MIRERTRPRFALGDMVLVKQTEEHGKVVDMWDEPGPLHCYTLRIGQATLKDFYEDELDEG